MSPRWIRRIVLVIGATSIVGMIVSSIAEENGIAVAFGIFAAVAMSALILVTAVGGPDVFTRGTVDEARAHAIEKDISDLVEAGADEVSIRRLVRQAVELGRIAGPPPRDP